MSPHHKSSKYSFSRLPKYPIDMSVIKCESSQDLLGYQGVNVRQRFTSKNNEFPGHQNPRPDGELILLLVLAEDDVVQAGLDLL